MAAVRAALGPHRRPDILTASPPCTPFSTATIPTAAHAAAAAQLQHTAAAICALRPRVAIIENVPAARLSTNWSAMRATLRAAGYSLEEAVVDAAKLGVPQRRRRVFLVATADGRHTGFEEAAAHVARQSDTTLQQHFPADGFADTELAYWHYGRYPKDSCLRAKSAPSPTLRSNCGYYPSSGSYVPRPADAGRRLDQTRRFAVEELATVAGWPRSAHAALPESRSAACRILGNSVAPPVMQFVAGIAIQHLDRKFRAATTALRPADAHGTVGAVGAKAAPARLGDEVRIDVQQDNPKRAGSKSHTRYEAYKAATTVGQMLAMGGTRGDVTNDVDHGYITVDGAVSPDAQDDTAEHAAPTTPRATPDEASTASAWSWLGGHDPTRFTDGPRAAAPEWPPGLELTTVPDNADMRRQQLADPFCGRILRYIQEGPDAVPKDSRRRVRAQAAHFVVHDGVLMRLGDIFEPGLPVTHRTVIPAALQHTIATEVHQGALGGHIGTTKLCGALRRRFYWVGQYSTARDVVKGCMRCVANKARLAAETKLRQPMTGERPWHHVHIDLWQPGLASAAGHKYVLTAIDRLTHWPEMVPLMDKRAETVADAFFENILCRHGTPAVVVSDNGTEFDGVFDVLARKYGVKRIRTSPYHPQANGIVERLHGYMRGSLAAMSTADQAQWHRLLPVTAFSYRATPVGRLGLTPFFLMHGREPVLPGELRAASGSTSPVETSQFVSTLQRRLGLAYSRARELEIQEKSQRLMQAEYVPDIQFAVGDKVLLHRRVVDPADSHKLTPRWVPQVVIGADHPSYAVQDASSRVSQTIVKFLRPDNTVAHTYGDHVPAQPSSAATTAGTPHAQLEDDTLAIVKSERADEPWCLVSIRGQNNDPAYVDVHFYNRANRAAPPDKWVWKPAWVDPRDNVDVLTYTPMVKRLQPYHRTLRRSDVMLDDVRLTRTGAICSADLRRISDADFTPWVFRRRRTDGAGTALGVGTHVLRRFGRHGKCTGRVTRVTGAGNARAFRVRYPGQQDQVETLAQVRTHAAQYATSGARHTAPAPQPSSSLLMQKRNTRAAKRRPKRTTTRERADLARADRARRRAVARSVAALVGLFAGASPAPALGTFPGRGTVSQLNATRFRRRVPTGA